MLIDLLKKSKYKESLIIATYLDNNTLFNTFDFEGDLSEQLSGLKIRQQTLIRLNKKIYGFDELVDNLNNTDETMLTTFCAENIENKQSFTIYYSPMTQHIFGVLVFNNDA